MATVACDTAAAPPANVTLVSTGGVVSRLIASVTLALFPAMSQYVAMTVLLPSPDVNVTVVSATIAAPVTSGLMLPVKLYVTASGENSSTEIVAVDTAVMPPANVIAFGLGGSVSSVIVSLYAPVSFSKTSRYYTVTVFSPSPAVNVTSVVAANEIHIPAMAF